MTTPKPMRRQLLDSFLEGLQASPSDPEDIGLIPLSVAAEWIGSRGGKVPFLPDDWHAWELAYGAIVAAAGKGRLKVHGICDGANQVVPRGLFQSTSVYLVDFDKPPNAPFAPSPNKGAQKSKYFVRAIIYANEEEWLDDHNDALLLQMPHRKDPGLRDKEWVQLQVRRRDVRRLWKLDRAELRTRAVGRATRRKSEALEIYRSLGPAVASGSITKISQRIAEILDARFPEDDPFKPRTIERYIREHIRSREK
ncbi:MAG: hypothetical protein ACT6XY_07050 [Phreatobacter sp.]|uniref:hypothetical protein n=1 Tax=Phreatobacter sp. TaxID=1966341 RepID=UPI004036FC0B